MRRSAWIGRFRHLDDVRRVDHSDVERGRIVVARQLGAHEIRTSDEIDADPEMPRGRQRAVDDARRRVIAAHRVDCDAHVGQGLAAVRISVQ